MGKVYNKIYDEEKFKNIDKFNKQLMEDYLMEMKSNKMKEGTIRIYKANLRILFMYILEEIDNKPIHKLKKKHFRNYKIWLQDKDMSPARINNLLCSMRSMLAFASDDDEYEDYLEINHAAKVKGLKNEKSRDIIFLTMEEMDIIRKELLDNKYYQQAAYCSLLIDTAARRNEIYQVEKDSITENGCKTNEVLGKRGKKFKLLYNDYTKEAVNLWLEQRGEDDIKSLWVTGKGENKQPVSYETLYVWCVNWRRILLEKTGEFKAFGPHSFRHSSLEELSIGDHYITKKLGKKLNLRQLQLLANHSDIGTTQGYLRNKDEDELMEAFGM